MKASHLYGILSRRYGWELDVHRPAAVDRAIANRTELLRISTPEEYVAGLAEDSLEFQNLLEELVIPESWFYRESEALQLVIDQLLPRQYIGPLRILSAPCARGEEPCTMSMMLQDHGWSKDSFQIDALDLSLLSIEKARQGLYTDYSFRGAHANLRQQYFLPHHSIWKVVPKVHETVRYYQENIFELPAHFTGYQTILCRNLLIYLTEDARRRLFTLLHSMLQQGGYLVVAACEFALPPADLFKPVQRKGIVVFQHQALSSLEMGFSANSGFPKSGKAPKATSLNNKIAQRPIRPQTLHTNSPTRPLRSAKREASDNSVAPLSAGPDTTVLAAQANDHEKSLLEMAREAADGGDLSKASQCCLRYLEQETTADGYYLLGVIYSAQGHLSDAEANFRRALYLRPEHTESLSQLALCRELAGDASAAARLRERRQRLLTEEAR